VKWSDHDEKIIINIRAVCPIYTCLLTSHVCETISQKHLHILQLLDLPENIWKILFGDYPSFKKLFSLDFGPFFYVYAMYRGNFV